MSNSVMRAKLQVREVTKGAGYEVLKMNAVGPKTAYPADGSDEDNTYARWSPQAEFSIHINNPNLHGKFAVGDKFYVDFTPAPDAPTA